MFCLSSDNLDDVFTSQSSDLRSKSFPVMTVTPKVSLMRHTLFDRLRVSASVGDYQPVSEEPEPGMEQAHPDIDSDEAEFGGREARLNLERRLLRKLDMRMSILVLIYVLNYVRLPHRRLALRSHLCSQVDRNNIS